MTAKDFAVRNVPLVGCISVAQLHAQWQVIACYCTRGQLYYKNGANFKAGTARAASKEPYSDGMAEHTGVPSRIPASNSSHTLFIAVIVPDTVSIFLKASLRTAG